MHMPRFLILIFWKPCQLEWAHRYIQKSIKRHVVLQRNKYFGGWPVIISQNTRLFSKFRNSPNGRLRSPEN